MTDPTAPRMVQVPAEALDSLLSCFEEGGDYGAHFAPLEGVDSLHVAEWVNALSAALEAAPQAALHTPAPQPVFPGRLAYLLACIHEEAERGAKDSVNPYASLRRIKALSDPANGDYATPEPAPLPGEVGRVLEMLAEFVEASAALDATEARLRTGTPFAPSELRDPIARRFAANATLEALDAARLRALAHSLPTPQPEAAGLREGAGALRDELSKDGEWEPYLDLAPYTVGYREGLTHAAKRLTALLLAHPVAQQQAAEAGEPIPLVKENPDGSVTLNVTINVTPGFRFHIEHTHTDLEARTLTPLHDGARFGLYRRVAAQPSGDDQ